MSKSVRSCKNLTVQVHSNEGIARQNSRICYHTGILRLLLGCALLLALPNVAHAQPPFPYVFWTGFDFGGANYTDPIGSYWTYGGTLTGSATGFPDGGTLSLNLSNWRVWDGSLRNEGDIEFFNLITVDQSLTNTGTIMGVGSLSVRSNLTNEGDMLEVGIGLVNGAIWVDGNLTNSGNIVVVGEIPELDVGGYSGSMYVGGRLVNNGIDADGMIGNYTTIWAGALRNTGIIATNNNGDVDRWLEIWVTGAADPWTINGTQYSFINGHVDVNDPDAGDNLISAYQIFLRVDGNFFNSFNGNIVAQADGRNYAGEIYVQGQLYNAGRIIVAVPPDAQGDPDNVWSYIYAQSLYNDGRLYTQGGYNLNDDYRMNNPAIIADAENVLVAGNLTNIGAAAVINGMVASNTGKYMDVGGDLLNLRRATLANYASINVHGSLENWGARLIGGHWNDHFHYTNDGMPGNEPDQRYQSGYIRVWGNVVNHTEYTTVADPDDYGGMILSFDEFSVHGSLYNDTNSIISAGTNLPNGDSMIPDDIVAALNIYNSTGTGRRAAIRNGIMFAGESSLDSATVLNVRGFSADLSSLDGQPPWRGLYNEGVIMGIDVIYVGNNNVYTGAISVNPNPADQFNLERGVLYNVVTTGNNRTDLVTRIVDTLIDLLPDDVPNPFDERNPAVIMDIGVLDVTNLYNAGIIADVDVSIDVAYAMVNTGVMLGSSVGRVAGYDYVYEVRDPDTGEVIQRGTPIWDNSVTFADLWVGKPTGNRDPNTNELLNPLVPGVRSYLLAAGLNLADAEEIASGIGIFNLGLIADFDTIYSQGHMVNAGYILPLHDELEMIKTLTVEGSVINAGTIQGVGGLTVAGEMENSGSIDNVNVIAVGGDFTSEGNISNVTTITVGSNRITPDEEGNPVPHTANMTIAGTLDTVFAVIVTGNLLITGSSMSTLDDDSDPDVPSRRTAFIDVGTVTAGGQIVVNTTVEGGYTYLAAGANKSGLLYVTELGDLTIDVSTVASGQGVLNEGDIQVDGTLNSGSSITNSPGATITNNGTISAHGDFFNDGTIVGKGIVSFNNPERTGTDRTFRNSSGGTVVGGLVVNGNYSNQGGTIKLVTERRNGRWEAQTIQVTNGTAAINGGRVDTGALDNLSVNRQYLFLATDRPGDLIIDKNMTADKSGDPGSVLDFTPFYGRYDSAIDRYIPGELWSLTNQYYWLEVGRAYEYGRYGKTPNQVAVGTYIDKISGSVKGNQDDNYYVNPVTGVITKKTNYDEYRNLQTGERMMEPEGMIFNPKAFWNLLIQLDGISDNPDYLDAYGQSWFNPNNATHQGKINDIALHALDQLSGVTYANLGPASVHNVGVINRSLGDVLRSDVFKFSMIGNPNNALRGQAIAPLRYSRWATLYGIGGTTQNDGNAAGYRQSFGGVLAGIDRAVWTGTRVGGWLSLSTGQVSTKDAWVDERADVTNVMVGMYMRQEMYYGYGLLSAGFGVDEYKTKRNLWLLGHRAESKVNGMIGTAYLERGIDIPVYYATVQPYTSFQVVGVSQDNFKETMTNQLGNRGYHSDIGLEGLKGSTDSYKMAVGARASSMPVPFRWGQFALTTNMAWFHEFNKNNRSFTARFANPGGENYAPQDTTFTIKGTNPKQDWINFGFGLNMDRNSTRLFLNGDLFANDQQTLFSAGGGFITSW